MKPVRRRIIGLTLAATWLLPVLAFAQSDKAENNDLLPLPKNIAELLDSRRDKSKTPINDDLLNKVAKNLPKGFDPRKFLDEATIKNLLRDNKELRDPKNIEGLRDLVKKHRADQPPSGLDLQSLDQALEQMQQTLSKDPASLPNIPMDPSAIFPNPMNPSMLEGGSANPLEQLQGKQDEKANEFFRMLARNFGDSPTYREIAKDLAKSLSADNLNRESPKFMDDVQNEWKSLLGSSFNDSSASKWGELFSRFRLPEMNPSGSRPVEHLNPIPDVGAASISSFPRGGDSAAAGDLGEFFLIAGLVGAGLLAWYFYLRSKPSAPANANTPAVVVPVDPLTVATREDVVRVFDAISIAKCGAEAINWHHRQIANDLGGKEPLNRDAVDHLAGLYEKARYAPTHEPFTDIEIAEARTRLCQIAGAPIQ